MSLPEQAAAIAVRGTGKNLEVCLIRRKGSKAWGIPKGMVDPGNTHAETALNEAWEEAGLTGRVIGTGIGTYQYEKWATTFTVARLSRGGSRATGRMARGQVPGAQVDLVQ